MLITGFWLTKVTFIGWIASTWMAIFPILFALLITNKGLGALSPIWWSSCWITLEGIRTHLIPFGWNPTASMTSDLALLQSASWGSQWIIGFVILLTNATIAFCIKRRNKPEIMNALLVWVVILLPLWAVGKGRLASPKYNFPEREIKVNIITNNIPYTEDLEKRWEILQANIKKTKETNNGYLTIWPESIGFVLLGHQAIWDSVKEMAQNVKGPILLTPLYPKGDKIYNSSILLENSGRDAQIYKKRHLTPVGEYLPDFVSKRLKIGKRHPGDDALNSTILIENSGQDMPYRAGMLICLEETISKAAHKRVSEGAELLISPSTHGDTGYSCAKQQAAMGRLKAIETGKTLIRSGNIGGSSVFDGLGRKIWSSDEDGIATVTVPILKVNLTNAQEKQNMTYWAIVLVFVVGLLQKTLTQEWKNSINRNEEFWA
jgi:apolipoprotein N-acyltransferase